MNNNGNAIAALNELTVKCIIELAAQHGLLVEDEDIRVSSLGWLTIDGMPAVNWIVEMSAYEK